MWPLQLIRQHHMSCRFCFIRTQSSEKIWLLTETNRLVTVFQIQNKLFKEKIHFLNTPFIQILWKAVKRHLCTLTCVTSFRPQSIKRYIGSEYPKPQFWIVKELNPRSILDTNNYFFYELLDLKFVVLGWFLLLLLFLVSCTLLFFLIMLPISSLENSLQENWQEKKK